jgi:DNA-directed RNA polymerase subunit M/transcription elongation factor TFIIS
MSYRELGKKALGTVLNIPKNVNIIEKYIFLIVCNDGEDEDKQEDCYKKYIYQIVGDILAGTKLKTLVADIKKGSLGWKHPSFDDMVAQIEEQDSFLECPFEIEEGVLQCYCGSKRVFSYSKQVRSSDEGMNTYAQCMACKSKWCHEG